MPTEILQKQGSLVCFGVAAEFNPADDGTNFTDDTIDYALTLSNVASAAGRQSAKADLGATRAARYACFAAVDFTLETPTPSGRVEYYWAPSTSGTTANGNVAGNSGNDGPLPDGALGTITALEFLAQCIFIGQLNTHDGASVQCGFVGYLSPPTRYGQMIVYNVSGDNFEQDDVEAHTVLVPITDEAQTA